MPEQRKTGFPPGKFLATVKLGAKGQIVIPKEARDMFGIAAGDSLLLLADSQRGLALHRLDHFNRIADEIFLNAGSGNTAADTDEADVRFAEAVKATGSGEESG